MTTTRIIEDDECQELAARLAERIREAQLETTVTIDGTSYQRVPYGSDYPDHPEWLPQEQCRICGVSIGQLHVPLCCLENCRSS
jgi:hypothetical protein